MQCCIILSFPTGGNAMRLLLFSRMLFKFRKQRLPQSVSTDSSHITETTPGIHYYEVVVKSRTVIMSINIQSSID